jgi:hypothetical protein
MMKRFLVAFVALLILVANVHSQNVTAASFAKAKTVLDRSVVAYGEWGD